MSDDEGEYCADRALSVALHDWMEELNQPLHAGKKTKNNIKIHVHLKGTVIYLLTDFHYFCLDTSSQVVRAADQTCDPLLLRLAARLLTDWTALQPSEKDLL